MQIGDLEIFNRFVQLCAGRNGQLLNLTSLANDSGISHTTARRWLSILETSFIVTLLRPHHRNFNKRLIKSPKLYFLDSGLLCYLLRIRSALDLATHACRGAVFESFVIAELLKNFIHRGLDPDLYFWRDATGHEIDVLIEQGQDLQALEIKSGQTVSEDFFKGLRFWCRLNGTDDLPLGLIYAGDQTYARKGVQVYSWSVL